MRITIKNYFKAVSEVGFENLPEALKKSHMLIEERTSTGSDWSIYEHNSEVKQVFDLAFEKLIEFIDKKEDLNGMDDELNGSYLTPREVAINLIKPYVLSGDTIELHPVNKLSVKDADYAAHIEKETVVVTMLYGTKISESFSVNELMDEIVKNYFNNKNSTQENSVRKKRTTFNHKQPEFKVLKAILNWHNANVSKRQVEYFINELQGYIKSKQITKDSIVANEIKLVQEKLITVFNSMGDRIKIELSPETKKMFQLALKKVTDVTKYNVPKKPKGLNGVEEVQEVKPKQNLMNSIDFANLHFNSIGFSGKWLNLIGDPSPGFTAMVFGRPKMGKSYLCVDFAGYLARNHGTVLYVANEEKLDATLQMKLNDKDVKHENLYVSDYLPENLSKYQFIILDSVNKLGLSPKDLENLKRNNPGKSFIFIFQTTKDGKFKGANSYQHDVDVVIEVTERGRATQFGRFNQGGEMGIFEDTPVEEPEELNGIKKSRKNLEVSKKVSNVATMKKKAIKPNDWTEAEHLNSSDKRDLKLVKKYYDEGDFKQTMNYASRLETIVREEIPPQVWQDIGGELTQTGKERLMTKDYENRADDINPRFIFSTVATALLVEALRGDFDLKQLVRRELAKRGQNAEGNWVGFDKAAQIHKIKK